MAKTQRCIIQPEQTPITKKPHSEEDYITRLPNEVLTHILSYIDTKSAVATSVLSTRWKHVWISVPNLDFGNYRSSLSSCQVKKAKFLNFVDRVLSLNNVLSVRKIHVDVREECELSRVDTWINGVAKRDADEIYLRLPRSCVTDNFDDDLPIYPLPDSFFGQKNLVKLHLEHVVLEIPSLVCFPCLETISLVQVQILDVESSSNLLSGCPVLRNLYIGRPMLNDYEALWISSPSLRCLTLNTLRCGREYWNDVLVNTPNLTELQIWDELGASYNMLNVSSLEKVDLRAVEVSREFFDDYVERVFELLQSIAHVKELRIDMIVTHSFDAESIENLPTFNNLTTLEIVISGDSWSILPNLFRSTPNLVNVVIKLNNVHPQCDWYEPSDVPRCFLSCIENVEISNLQECDEEFEMVFYILQNAMVLKKLKIISFGSDFVKHTKILIMLTSFPRASSACQVEYEPIFFM